MSSAPVIRSILDLVDEELQEATQDRWKNEILRTFARLEKEKSGSLFASAGDVVRFKNLEERAPLGVQIIVQRLSLFYPTCTISPLMLGLVSATLKNPAEAVMWAHTLAAWHARIGTPASIDNIVVKYLGGRLPTEEAYKTLWEEQKCRLPDRLGTDNWLDYLEVWTPQALRAAQVTRGEGQFVASPSG